MSEDSRESRHRLWTAIGANLKVHAVRELHRPEMDAGNLPTGKCRECSKTYPCPTAQAVAQEPDRPCGCAPGCLKSAAPKQTRQLLDGYAHELAERQRQALRDAGYDLSCVCGGCTACLAGEYIDLTDPSKEDV